MRFKIDTDHNIVSYAATTWHRFPAPRVPFKIRVENREYVTSKRNLKAKCTSLGKIHDTAAGERITHREFCARHGLRIDSELRVTTIMPFELYRLVR